MTAELFELRLAVPLLDMLQMPGLRGLVSKWINRNLGQRLARLNLWEEFAYLLRCLGMIDRHYLVLPARQP